MLPDDIRSHPRLGKAAAWVVRSANSLNQHFNDKVWGSLTSQFRQAYFHLGRSTRTSPNSHRVMAKATKYIQDESARPFYFILNSLYFEHPKPDKLNEEMKCRFRLLHRSPPLFEHMPEDLTLIPCNPRPLVSRQDILKAAEQEDEDDYLPRFLTPTDALQSEVDELRAKNALRVAQDQIHNHARAITLKPDDLNALVELTKRGQERQVHRPQAQELFPGSDRATWQAVVKWARERNLPVASAIVQARFDPRRFTYSHLADDQPYFDADKDKWDAIFTHFGKKPSPSSTAVCTSPKPGGEGHGRQVPGLQTTKGQPRPVPTADTHSKNPGTQADFPVAATESSEAPQPKTPQEQSTQPEARPTTEPALQSPLVKLIELLQVMGEVPGNQMPNNHGAWKAELEKLAALQERSAADRISISDDMLLSTLHLADLAKKRWDTDQRDKAVNSLLQQIISTREGATVCAMLGGSDLSKVQSELEALEKRFEHKGDDST